MGKKIECPGCKMEIVFWGNVPSRHKCGRCGEKINLESTAAVCVDPEGKPIRNAAGGHMVRRKRPGL